MTPQERQLIWDLVIMSPSGTRRISKEEFLRRFPSSVQEGKVSLALFEAACKARNAGNLQCALIVGAAFDFGHEHLDVLCSLVDADWHRSHEDVVSALDKLRTPLAITALFRATQWVPEYLDFDESRALAVKAIWALGKIPGDETASKFELLASSDDPILKKNALHQLERRKS